MVTNRHIYRKWTQSWKTVKKIYQQFLWFVTIDVLKIEQQHSLYQDIITLPMTPIINTSFNKHTMSWELIHSCLIHPPDGPARYPGMPGNKTRDSRQCGGRRLLKLLHQHPIQVLTATQVKGESTRTTIGSLGRTTGAAWHRPPVSFGRAAGDNQRYWGGDQ